MLAVGESWSGATLDAWMLRQAAPDAGIGARIIETVTAGVPHLRLKCSAGDVAPLTPNSNPRAQLVSPQLIEQGNTYRVAVDLLIPATAIPKVIDKAAGHWVEFVQFAYGKPNAGSPPLRIFTMDGKTFGLRLGDTLWGWSAGLECDVWWRFVCEFRHAPDGWYRLLVSKGLTSTPREVVPKTPYATVAASNGAGPNSLYLDAYMQAGTADRIGPFFFHAPTITRLA